MRNERKAPRTPEQHAERDAAYARSLVGLSRNLSNDVSSDGKDLTTARLERRTAEYRRLLRRADIYPGDYGFQKRVENFAHTRTIRRVMRHANAS